MEAPAHPNTASEITLEWIAYALEEAGICRALEVSSIDVQPLGGEVKGLLSSICRVNISYEILNPDLPGSLVLKFPPVEEINREFAQRFRANERELMFYRQVAPTSPVCVPKCYYNYVDRETGNCVLVLEDEKDWKPGNQIDGLSRKQVESAIGAISKFHARWWNSPELDSLDWMPHKNRNIRDSYAEYWLEFKQEHKDILRERDIQAGELISVSGLKIEELLRSPPMTIAHNDFRADNLMFKEDGRVLVLDWQIACRMSGAYDVARVVCGSLKEEISYRDHQGLVELWYEGLLRAGIGSYTHAEALHDYLSALILYSYTPVCAHHLISHEGSRGVPLLKAMIIRIFRALHECRALELIK